MSGKFRCSGQTCVCPNRIFVHRAIHDKYVEMLSKAVSKLVVGCGMEKNVNIGPLINQRAVDKVALFEIL